MPVAAPAPATAHTKAANVSKTKRTGASTKKSAHKKVAHKKAVKKQHKVKHKKTAQ